MKMTVSGKGSIVLPAEFRRRDGIKAGQEFKIKRIKRGEYLLKRKTRLRNEGLVNLLRACPVKGWFPPLKRIEATDEVEPAQARMTVLADGN